MTKRKVTDLLPSEAILISSDADLKVLDEFEKAGITWIDGALATSFNPFAFAGEIVSIYLELDKLTWSFWSYSESLSLIILPATDFIPTESDEVKGSVVIEADNSIQITINPDYERQLLVDYHNFILDDPKAKECDIVGESVELFLKTRNTRTNERN